MKKCYTCSSYKDELQFNKNKVKKDGLNTICKECSKNRSKQYYRENTEHHKKVIKKRKDENDEVVRAKIIKFLKQNPCVNCRRNQSNGFRL
jgi:protein-arginine kinase activator protein McsA